MREKIANRSNSIEQLLITTKRYATKPETTLVSRDEDGQEFVYNLNEPLHHSYIVDGVVFKGMERHLQNKWGLAPAN